MNYMEIETASVSNGPGFRVVLYVSGCTLHCNNCQNQQSWGFDAGQPYTEQINEKMFQVLSKDYVRGITLTGGHPLELQNVEQVYKIVMQVRERLPQKDIWLYTGHTLSVDDFFANPNSWMYLILTNCDVVVDGPYIDSMRDVTLAFRGSTNQRLIDVKSTIAERKIVELHLD